MITNDDRPTSPQPAIAPSAESTPLTIESLAGIYKGVIDEKALKKLLSDLKKQISSESRKHGANVPVELEWFEGNLRQPYERMRIIINADGTFEGSFIAGTSYGKVKIDGDKLIFTTDTTRLMDGVDGSTNSPKCSDCCTFTLNVSTDRKTLLFDEPSNPSQLLRGYVKQ